MSVVYLKSRFINALKCYWNYALSLFGLVRISHTPLFVSVEPAAVCQLRCPECPVGLRQSSITHQSSINRTSSIVQSSIPTMSLDLWHRVLSEIRDTAFIVQFYFQGEPLLNKDLPKMIAEAHEAGLYTIVSTNAQALTPELAKALVAAGLNRIIVSMDGLSEESYGTYRIGGNLAQTKAALLYLREAKEQLKSHMMIELQCLRLRTNEHEWAEFKRRYKQLGADRLVFKTAQLYDYKNGNPLMPSDARYSRYIKGADGLYHRRRLSRICWRAWSGAVVTTNGEVLPCCYDKSCAHAYGNIKVSSLRELFGNEKALAFRKAALCQTPQICQQCYK